MENTKTNGGRNDEKSTWQEQAKKKEKCALGSERLSVSHTLGDRRRHHYHRTKSHHLFTMTDAFGATPLPPVSKDTLKVWYNPTDTFGQAQQPHAQQVAAFEAVPNDDCKNGSVLDVNQHFLVYAVKNGLLRVLHRASSVRSLLRGHLQKITDVSFFQNGDVLGTVGGNVIIWRIFYTSPEIHAEKLLEIPSIGTSRIVWHPFNPNQFWLLHTNKEGIHVATLVETTRITTTTTTILLLRNHHKMVLWEDMPCVSYMEKTSSWTVPSSLPMNPT